MTTSTKPSWYRPPLGVAGLRERQHPPYGSGNTEALKHGGTRATLSSSERADAHLYLFGQPDSTGMPPAVRATRTIAVDLWVRRQRVLAWVEDEGLFRVDGTLQPALKLADQWDSKLLRILAEHGGTPLALAQLTRVQAEARLAIAQGNDLVSLASQGRAVLDARVIEPAELVAGSEAEASSAEGVNDKADANGFAPTRSTGRV